MQSKILPSDQGRRSFIEEARRTQIIDCAIQAIAELGYAQASLAQIAKRAGVSTGVISYYFAGKDDLIDQVVAQVYQTGEAFVRPRVEGKATERESLLAFIAANVAFVIAYPGYMAAMVEIIASNRVNLAGDPRFHAATEVRRAPLREILERGQADGDFRAFSVQVMADVIIEAIDMAAYRQVDERRYAADLVDLFDHATRASAQPPLE